MVRMIDCPFGCTIVLDPICSARWIRGGNSVSDVINFTVAALSSFRRPLQCQVEWCTTEGLQALGQQLQAFQRLQSFTVPSVFTGLKVGPLIPKLGVFLLIEGLCKIAFVSGVLAGQLSARKVYMQ